MFSLLYRNRFPKPLCNMLFLFTTIAQFCLLRECEKQQKKSFRYNDLFTIYHSMCASVDFLSQTYFTLIKAIPKIDMSEKNAAMKLN
jgi:hypothetical protein